MGGFELKRSGINDGFSIVALARGVVLLGVKMPGPSGPTINLYSDQN